MEWKQKIQILGLTFPTTNRQPSMQYQHTCAERLDASYVIRQLVGHSNKKLGNLVKIYDSTEESAMRKWINSHVEHIAPRIHHSIRDLCQETI